MKFHKNSLVLTAAFTGLLGGTMTRLSASPTTNNLNPSMSSANQLAGQFAGAGKDDNKASKDTNSCKGKGGCGNDSSKKNTSKKDKK
jgi:hypothetical protein